MQNQTDRFALARARKALDASGLPAEGVIERVSSTRNEVFLNPDYAIRVNRQQNQRLRREAMICGAIRHRLPNAAWSPTIISHGGEIGADYLIVARRAGSTLARSWPTMSRDERRRATTQLGHALRQLHEVPTPANLPRLPTTTHLIDPRCVSPMVPVLVAIDQLRSNSSLDPGFLRDIENRLMSTGSCLDDYHQRTLIHGDLSFENIMWDGRSVSGLLDFEWCRGASSDLDLDVLLRYCAFPQAHVPADIEANARAEDYLDLPFWIAEAYPDLFSHPRLAERLVLYSLAFDVRDLAENSETRTRNIGPLHPIRRITALLEDGGHLRPLLANLGVAV